MNLFAFNTDLIQKLIDMFPNWLKENVNVPKSEFLIPTVVDELVNQRKATMKILNTDSVWFGVTYKEDKPGVVKALKELVNKGVYPPNAWLFFVTGIIFLLAIIPVILMIRKEKSINEKTTSK